MKQEQGKHHMTLIQMTLTQLQFQSLFWVQRFWFGIDNILESKIQYHLHQDFGNMKKQIKQQLHHAFHWALLLSVLCGITPLLSADDADNPFNIIHYGDTGAAVFLGAVRIADELVIGITSDLTHPNNVRENGLILSSTNTNVIYRAVTNSVSGASEYIEISGGSDSSSGDSSTASTIFAVTDTTTIGELTYEFIDIPEGKRFKQGYPVVRVGSVDFTDFIELLDGSQVSSEGESNHRGFRLTLDSAFTLNHTMRALYVLEDFTAIGFEVSGGNGGIALPTTIKLDHFGGLRRF